MSIISTNQKILIMLSASLVFFFVLFGFSATTFAGGGGGGGGGSGAVWQEFSGYASFQYDTGGEMATSSISFNCDNNSSCGTSNYVVEVDIQDKDSASSPGEIQGKAWNDVLG